MSGQQPSKLLTSASVQSRSLIPTCVAGNVRVRSSGWFRQNSAHDGGRKRVASVSCGSQLSRLNLIQKDAAMNCPRCNSSKTKQSDHKTALGYRTFRCFDCTARFNERTGTPFNNLQFPTDIVLLVVLGRLRYKLSLRDLAEMFLERGFEFTHEAVR